MLTYVARRLLQMIPLLLGITVVLFGVIQAAISRGSDVRDLRTAKRDRRMAREAAAVRGGVLR